jgi:hypothetical protein
VLAKLQVYNELTGIYFKYYFLSGQNPNKNYICVQVEIPQYKQYASIIYPSIDEIKKLIKATSDKSQDEVYFFGKTFVQVYLVQLDTKILVKI